MAAANGCLRDPLLNIVPCSAPPPCCCSGTVCSDAVPDALCQGLGFDRAWGESAGGEAPRVVNATREEAVRSLTGEYCLRDGLYAPTVPENLTALPGEPCRKLDGITCIRHGACYLACCLLWPPLLLHLPLHPTTSTGRSSSRLVLSTAPHSTGPVPPSSPPSTPPTWPPSSLRRPPPSPPSHQVRALACMRHACQALQLGALASGAL